MAKHTIRARLKYSYARTLTLPLKVPRRGEKGAAFAGEMSGFTFGYSDSLFYFEKWTTSGNKCGSTILCKIGL